MIREAHPNDERCREVEVALGPFIDGELEDARSAAVREHLALCPPCAAARGRLARLEAIARAAARPPAVAPGEWAERAARLSDSARVVRSPRFLRFLPGALAAAAAALLLATAAVPFFADRAGPPPAPPEQPSVEVLELFADGYMPAVIYPQDESQPLVIVLSKL